MQITYIIAYNDLILINFQVVGEFKTSIFEVTLIIQHFINHFNLC